MDKFTEHLTGGLRRFAMAGVGAVSVTIGKSKEVFDHLAEKGEAAAAETQVSCDELQKKLSGQLDAFARKLKTDHENASFEQLLQKCLQLSPEQKALLIGKLTAEPEPEEAPDSSCPEESASPCSECCEEPEAQNPEAESAPDLPAQNESLPPEANPPAEESEPESAPAPESSEA